MLFSPLVIILLFKLNSSIYIRVALALIPSSLATLFMFTRIPIKAIHFLKFLRKRQFSLMDKEMKELLQVKNIENEVTASEEIANGSIKTS